MSSEDVFRNGGGGAGIDASGSAAVVNGQRATLATRGVSPVELVEAGTACLLAEGLAAVDGLRKIRSESCGDSGGAERPVYGASSDWPGMESVWVTCGERGWEGVVSRRAASPCAVGGVGSAAGGGIPEAAAAMDLLSVLYSLSLQRHPKSVRIAGTGKWWLLTNAGYRVLRVKRPSRIRAHQTREFVARLPLSDTRASCATWLYPPCRPPSAVATS